MAYTTDLTEPQFERLDSLLPQSRTYNSVISRHKIINAVFYQLKNGCQWRDLPADFPNWQTVYSQCAPVADGRNVGSRVERVGEQRAGSGKKNRFPSLLIGDSMCAKNTDTANRETKGYCWYKATNGSKRHLLVDVPGTRILCIAHGRTSAMTTDC